MKVKTKLKKIALDKPVMLGKLKVNAETVRDMRRLLRLKTAAEDENKDVIQTFTVKFDDGWQADIKVCNGCHDSGPYVDPVLFDEGGGERHVLDVQDDIVGKFEFDCDGRIYVAVVEVRNNSGKPLSDREKADYLKDSVHCPRCGGESLNVAGCQIDGPEAVQFVACGECEQEWRDVYKLAGVEDAS